MRHARDGRASLPRRSRWRNSDGLSGTASQRERRMGVGSSICAFVVGRDGERVPVTIMLKGSSVLFHAPRPRVCDLASRVRGNTPMASFRDPVRVEATLTLCSVGTVVRRSSSYPAGTRVAPGTGPVVCGVVAAARAPRPDFNSDGTRRCPTRAGAGRRRGWPNADARRCPRPASPRRDRPAGARARFPDPAVPARATGGPPSRLPAATSFRISRKRLSKSSVRTTIGAAPCCEPPAGAYTHYTGRQCGSDSTSYMHTRTARAARNPIGRSGATALRYAHCGQRAWRMPIPQGPGRASPPPPSLSPRSGARHTLRRVCATCVRGPRCACLDNTRNGP